MSKQYSANFLDLHRDINVDHDWWDCICEDFRQICEILGIYMENKREPMFTGFWSQGDGASWAGRYCSRSAQQVITYDTAPTKIREHAPEDEVLHKIADRLCQLNRLYTPVFAKVTRASGNYVHDHMMQVAEWEFYDEERNDEVPPEIAEHIETELLDVFRDLARWLYAYLEEEYNHLTSDEAVADTLEANEIEEEKEEEECMD